MIMHVLLPEALSSDFQVAKDQIYGAIKKGHLFIGHDAIAASKGFRLAFSGESGTCALMGEELRFEPGSLTVELPLRGLIRIIRNGREYSKGEANQFEAKVQKPGVYRVEVYKKTPIFGWRPWIFSNPIFLR